MHICISWASLVLSSKESACNAGDLGDMNSILESGRFPGEGNDNRLPISCLENRRDRGEWWAAVHRAGKNQTQLSDCTHTHTHTHKYKYTDGDKSHDDKGKIEVGCSFLVRLL